MGFFSGGPCSNIGASTKRLSKSVRYGFFSHRVPPVCRYVFLLILLAIVSVSLLASFYIYDKSDLYEMKWAGANINDPGISIVNIHAGFDETSRLLAHKFPEAGLQVFDFYNREMHTEISIERARKRYAPYAGTKTISTAAVPLEPASVDVVFLLLAAHEIRDPVERTIFFKELRRCLAADGRIVVLEHLRDAPNFIAYTIGFLHFFSGANWRRTFEGAQLTLEKEKKITPFLSAFILQKNGIAS